jgi:hypothetical protein
MIAKQIAKLAKELGLARGKGTYNGAAYWLRDGKIVTGNRVLELAGY